MAQDLHPAAVLNVLVEPGAVGNDQEGTTLPTMQNEKEKVLNDIVKRGEKTELSCDEILQLSFEHEGEKDAFMCALSFASQHPLWGDARCIDEIIDRTKRPITASGEG